MRQHTEPIGQLGVRYECPICKNRNLVWDHSSDVSSCLNCGWDNRQEAEENYNSSVYFDFILHQNHRIRRYL